MSRNFGTLKKQQDRQLKGFNPEAPMDDGRNDWPFQESPDPKPDNGAFWKIGSSIVLIVSFAFIAMAFILFACSARAHIKDRPELDAWMNGLQSKGGYPCCSSVDGSTVADVDWDTAVVNGENHYRVRINGVWIVVSPEEVVEGPNRFGPAIAWVYRDSVGVPNVRCFMPGAGG